METSGGMEKECNKRSKNNFRKGNSLQEDKKERRQRHPPMGQRNERDIFHKGSLQSKNLARSGGGRTKVEKDMENKMVAED